MLGTKAQRGSEPEGVRRGRRTGVTGKNREDHKTSEISLFVSLSGERHLTAQTDEVEGYKISYLRNLREKI